MKSELINIDKDDFPVHFGQLKSTLLTNSAIDSGILCQECSLCCTGAIFTHITISDSESTKLQKLNIKRKNDDIKMNLPCPYLEKGSCSVYDMRPKKCQTYTCILLDKVICGEIVLIDAIKIVNVTKEQAKWLSSNVALLLKDEDIEMNLRIDLYTINKLFFSRLENDEKLIFSAFEYQFCLCALDYLKGLSMYFNVSSLLVKYNNLVIKMQTN